jgi:hypothetical protein
MPLKALFLLLLGLALIGASYLLTRPPDEPPAIEDMKSKEPEEVRKKKFFDEQVIPALEESKQRNNEAMQRAKDSLKGTFDRYRRGIAAYTEDLTSFWTQLKIAKAAVADRIYERHEAAQIASEAFEKHVFSEGQLETDLVAITEQFTSDLAADQNILLASIETRLRKADFPAPPVFVDGRSVLMRSRGEVEKFAQTNARNSTVVSITAFAGGAIVGEAGVMLVRSLLVKVGTHVALRVSATGGAIAAGAAGGGALGTGAAPGVGTAIGIAVGLALGSVVEMWMGDRFREKMASECTALLAKIEEDIWNDSQQGLHASFAVAAEQANQRNEQTMLQLLTLNKASQ